jgi:hypothetical protein
MQMPFALAFNAPAGGAQYQVVGHTLEEECGKDKDDPFPPPGSGGGTGGGGGGGGTDDGCGYACAGSNGDPHLHTVSGAYYDFQAAGEFTLLRSADGSLEIQARQEPYADSDHVAINTAVAARVNGHRVGIYFTGSALAARVDGQASDLTSPLDLGDGAALVRHSRGFELDFPDGTQLWALSLGAYGINAQVRPSDDLRRSGVGILGPVLPGGLGVPKLPDGTRLPRAANSQQRYQLLYGTFAAAWHVTDPTTLFDYDAGKSTASYTRAGFPNQATDSTVSDISPTQREQAAPACAAIVDPLLYQQCLYDVIVTGDAGFVDIYRITLQLIAQGVITLDTSPTGTPPPPTSPVPGASVTPGPSPVGAALTGVELIRGWTVGPDGTLYLSVLYSDDRNELDAIDPQGVVISRTDAKGSGALAFAAGSLWAAEFNGDIDCATSRLEPQTLAVQATIDTPCDLFGTTLVSAGDAVWYVDRSLDGYTHEGLRRIDPVANTPGDPVVLPFFNGYLYGTPSGLVYGDDGADKGWYRLAQGQTTLQSLGVRGAPIYATDGGIWNEEDQVADFFNSDGPPAQSIPIDGPLVGADDSAVYVEQTGDDLVSQLWRYPLDGSDPKMLSQARPDYGDQRFSFFDNDPLITTGSAVIKVWFARARDSTPSALFVQSVPTAP